MLDSDHHASVFGVTSILAEAVAAAAIGLRAVSSRRSTLLFVAALVGALAIPRALMRFEPAFERYDVVILVAPLTVVGVVLCALTFRDARRVRVLVWGSLVLLACSFALHAIGPQADAGGRAGRTWRTPGRTSEREWSSTAQSWQGGCFSRLEWRWQPRMSWRTSTESGASALTSASSRARSPIGFLRGEAASTSKNAGSVPAGPGSDLPAGRRRRHGDHRMALSRRDETLAQALSS